MSIELALRTIKNTLKEGVTLVAVSKTHPIEAISEAYQAGQRIFGENRVQELQEKQPLLPNDIQWHLIGHLQKNKVKYIAPYVAMIHAVDSIELLEVIQKEAAKNNRTIDCLIQIYIADENSKFGFSYEEAESFFNNVNLQNYPNVRFRGLMGMATFTDDAGQVRTEFAGLKSFFNRVKSNHPEWAEFNELSMGMSGDYSIAVEEGSTMIRVGSAIFGAR
jgi:PLP dependent protein